MGEIVEKVTPIVKKLAQNLNLEIINVEWVKEGGNDILRVIADSSNGLTVEESTTLNEALSEKLDEEDFIEDEYFLEVSSPGLERELYDEEDINNALDDYVHVSLKESILDDKEWEGYLIINEDDVLTLEVNIKGRIKKIEINKSNINKIRLAVKF